MSHPDKLGAAYQRRVDDAAGTDVRRKNLDWALLVVTFALVCTLGWIYLLLWGAVRVFQVIIS